MSQQKQITRDDLMSLEQYAERRPEFRQQVLAHKKHRQVMLGPNATLGSEWPEFQGHFYDRIYGPGG